MGTNHKKVLIFGELLWDMLPTGPRPGGAPANVAVQTHSAGADCLLISAVGDDEPGRELTARFRAQGACADGIQVARTHPTGTVDVTLTPDGKPSYKIHANVAWDHIKSPPALRNTIAKASALYFGSLAQRSPVSQKTLREIADLVPATCLRFFDINLRHPLPHADILRDSLGFTDILKLNDEELPHLARMLRLPENDNTFTRALFAHTPVKTIILTNGPAGATLFEHDRPAINIPATPVNQIADTIGAGDAFSSGFLVGQLRGLSNHQSAKLGNDFAARVCQIAGAWPPPLEKS